jgi:dinuclear metal center YbgI/SA1388 family protein
MLIVHHGLFWGKVLMVRGSHALRLRACLAAELSLYAVHFPLDAHPALGNNAGMLEDAGFTPGGRFAQVRGFDIGYVGEHADGLTLDEIIAALERSLACPPARILGKYDGRKIRKAAAITGGALSYAEEAAVAGAEIFLTGEGSHSAYHQTLESGILTLLYGHYASEMIGIRRLAAYCQKQYDIESAVIDIPTGW